MNDLLLKVHMKGYGDTTETLAKALNIHPHTLYMKMREDGAKRKQQFTQAEIRLITERYNLSPEDVVKIFFSLNYPN